MFCDLHNETEDSKEPDYPGHLGTDNFSPYPSAISIPR